MYFMEGVERREVGSDAAFVVIYVRLSCLNLLRKRKPRMELSGSPKLYLAEE